MNGTNSRFMRALGSCLAGLAVWISAAPVSAGPPLLDGLGGPLGYGDALWLESLGTIDITPLFPGGVRFYDEGPYAEVATNRPGSVSFGQRICCINSTWALPAPPLGPPGMSRLLPPRIVGFRGAGVQSRQDEEEQNAYTFQALVPPAGDDPGRYISTWYRVFDRPPGLAQPPLVNSWQTVITPVGPDGDFDLELRYVTCEWTRAPLRPDVPFPVVGFDAGLGEDGPGWMWPGSLSEDTILLCELSNVREPGIFRYAFRDGWPSGCGYDAEPPPGADRCADGNHLPGDGCSPACYVEPDVDGDGRYEAPHPDSVDPLGVYDDCTDLDDPLCNDDPDGDGLASLNDNCPDDFNPEQRNYDQDALGDACDNDGDGDALVTVVDPEAPFQFLDLCPLMHSAGTRRVDPDLPIAAQASDLDGDGIGDPCDDDDDGDGILDCGADGICSPLDNGYDDDRDNAIDEADECQPGSQFYEACDGSTDAVDNDRDGYVDEFSERDLPRVEWPGPDREPMRAEDNCRRIPNPDQGDLDGDGIGDACDADLDGDGIDNCGGDGICGPGLDRRDNDSDGAIDEAGECDGGCDPAFDRVDQDFDGFVDEAFEVAAGPLPGPLDNCPLIANRDQADRNGDGIGDACADDDEDMHPGREDNCPDVFNPEQSDLDRDGIGDACDADDDGDGVPDVDDVCPRVMDPEQADLDGDGIGDVCDPDDDEDGVVDGADVCPRHFDPEQADLDRDGAGDVCDEDDDGDGTPDEGDRCPRVADDQRDTDGDGEGDACDADDDGDGIDDAIDGCPRVADPTQADLDGDGTGDACDDTDDRPFDVRTPAERCALLVARGASTAERLRHCPPGSDDGCRVAPRSAPRWPWLLIGLGLGLRRRRLSLARPAADG